MTMSDSRTGRAVVSCSRSSVWQLALTIFFTWSITGCALSGSKEPAWKAAVAGDGTGNPSLVKSSPWKVTNLPKSRSGNRSQYTVFDETYEVLDTARNFREWGVASWYGRKFHGRQTASGEVYDMYVTTAAHRQLPLPTFVRVTRIDNNRTIVVKVNDRGPFVDDRIIDLSYAAAAELGMLETGTADVYIEAISTHEIDASPAKPVNANPLVAESQASDAPKIVVEESVSHFVQVGAYAERANAEFMMSQLQRSSDLPVIVDFESGRDLYRVRIGPLSEGQQMDSAVEILASTGIEGYKVTTRAR